MEYKLIEEIICNWKLEAKQEDSNRFFYNTSEADELLSGNKYYLIGRKGSGKSAICQHLLSIDKADVFSDKLSFKSFSFNQMYELSNNDFTHPNQYITIWKYIIYSKICSLMVKNEKIDSNIRSILSKIYPKTSPSSLRRMIKDWVSSSFGVSIAKIGINFGTSQKQTDFSKLDWINKCDYLEDVINEYIDDSYYYLVFDELDEDYRDFKSDAESEKYRYLITSLFKAVQDVRSSIKSKYHVFPIVFLRDDIYAIIRDSDKNKWSDFKINLDWTEEKIKSLIAHRISMTIPDNKKILPFQEAWESIFSTNLIKMGARQSKSMKLFDYITLSTQLRPRDYIKYIYECCDRTYRNGNNYDKITPNTVKFVDKGFSNYLKDEITDEIYPLLPEIDIIFSIISQIRKWNFSVAEFKKVYLEYLEKGTIKEKNTEFVLQTLFNFSVIGNAAKKRKGIFFYRYKNNDARFNFQENIVVHRGLLKALQIY